MSEKKIQALTLRMTPELYQKVLNAAAENRVSINNFICSILEGTTTFTLEDKIKELEKRVEVLENKK